MWHLNLLWLPTVIVALISCKTVTPQANLSGIGTDLDNPERRLYLYTVEDDQIIRQYECPRSRPIIRSNCAPIGWSLVLESFESKLRDAITQDIEKTKRLIAVYTKTHEALIQRADRGDRDALDIRAQAEKILNERSKEESQLADFNSELTGLDDTLSKLKDQDLDFEITHADDWYKENRSTVSRFRSLMSISKRYMDEGHGKYSQLMYDSLVTATEAVRKNCPDDIPCTQWIAQQAKQLDLLESTFPTTESHWDLFEFGPVIAQQSQELATQYCRVKVTGHITQAFVAYANRLKEKILDPLQTRSPSLGGKLNGCTFRVN